MTISPKKILLEKIKKIALISIIVLIFLMAGAYAYFVNQAVLNVVERENLDEEIAEMTSGISSMESEYIKKIDAIDKNMAYNRGYREATNKRFILKKPPAEGVSLKEDE